MRFYSLEFDIFNSSAWRVGDVQEIDNWRLVSPPALSMDDEIRNKKLYAPIESDGRRTDFTVIGYADIPMVNFKTLKAIPGSNGFTAIPILFTGGRQKDTYHLLHVWESVDCFDRKESCYNVFSSDDPDFSDRAGEYCSVTKLILNPDRATGKDIFRISGLLDVIVISEKLKDRLEKIGVTGVSFKSVNADDYL